MKITPLSVERIGLKFVGIKMQMNESRRDLCYMRTEVRDGKILPGKHRMMERKLEDMF